MKILLIVPKWKCADGRREQFDSDFSSLITGKKKYHTGFLSLPTIAALTPKDVEVEIIDENIHEIDFDKKVDLVGISVPTLLAPRSYKIADEFRKRGVKVVLGGYHVSMLPEEALKHCDTVVIGEAENVWDKLISDFKNNSLQNIYKSRDLPDLALSPVPRWDLADNKLYTTHRVQTTRGCPYDCEFCCVKAFSGKRYRHKPIENVLMEIENLLSIEKKLFFFVDDNLVGDKKWTKELLKRIIPYGIVYWAQCPINSAEDTELLELLAESGCVNMFVGFESVSNETIKAMNKNYSNDTEQYYKSIEKIQSYGIGIQASFVFGYDTDDENVFKKTVEFVNNSNLQSAVFHILTPFPGTKIFHKLDSENRILHKDWSKYDATHVCFKPKNMSEETLQNGWLWANQQVFSYESIFRRLKNLWSLWNNNNVRLNDRISPIIANLSCNDRIYNSIEESNS